MSQPNILFLLVDELRFPTTYDNANAPLMTWMQNNLLAQTALKASGVTFNRHYVASTACAPSRTSLFTGHYPTLHGVTGTDGVGKHGWDRGMFWLDPDTVPTLGDWLRAGGYETYYKGKWHISMADLITPGTHNSVDSNGTGGQVNSDVVAKYLAANRLEGYGFDGWVGPEPHGAAQSNSGYERDGHFADQAVELIDDLELRPSNQDKPLLLVSSFVNPHDIVLYGPLWTYWGLPVTDATLNFPIAEAPTQGEDLAGKPTAQASYVENYARMFQDQPKDEAYRRFYYYVQKLADAQVKRVYDRFMQSRFATNSIVIFTSDHGELLGAHGGMQQKWYQAYEEAIHVPLIIRTSTVTTPRQVNTLTSHIDLIPTILGLAGVNVSAALDVLNETHTETQPLVGRDLSQLITGVGTAPAAEPVYFMTRDNVSVGIEQIIGDAGWPPVDSPNHVETIVVDIDGVTWKYSRYFQEPSSVVATIENEDMLAAIEEYTNVDDQYEMYDLTNDPREERNLAGTNLPVETTLKATLVDQSAEKALEPGMTGTYRAQGEGLLTTATV